MPGDGTMHWQTFFKILRFLRWHIIGRCPICGKLSLFICLDRFDSAKNHLSCLFCRSVARNRLMARVLLEEAKSSSRSIAGFAGSNTLSIYHTATTDVFNRLLQKNEYFTCSDYFPDVRTGTVIGERQYCQNLEALTFADNSFDIVITEDVFEHIRDDSKAFAEVYRVLKPGGVHLFTVPFLFDRPTLQRIDTSGMEDRMLTPPEYHGDPIRGQILAYRTYGIDLFARLERIGFTTQLIMSQYGDRVFGIADCYVFVSRKG